MKRFRLPWPHTSLRRKSFRNFRRRFVTIPNVSLPLLSLLIATTGCGGGGAGSMTPPPPPNPTKTLTSVSIAPASLNLSVGSTQQLTGTATYSDGSTSPVDSSATWSSSNSTVASVAGSGMVTADASGSASLNVAFGGMTGHSSVQVETNVTTWHFDNNRSGWNSGEATLTPQNVNPQSFGKLFSYLVDGYVYAQPLVVSNLTVNGATHNVVFVATEKDSVYAFDADQVGNGKPLWSTSLIMTGETPITNASIQPYLGVTSTPVIDPTTNTMYVVSTQNTPTGGTFRLHALDITTGVEKLGGPVTIQASVPGTNSDSVDGVVTLTTSCLQRAALLLADNSIYIGFGSCHSGWLLSYSAKNLTQTGVFNASPNLNGDSAFGGAGGIWMGGGGPAADDSGNIFVTTGNGPYDGATAYGDSVLKFDSQLHLLDNFTPHDFDFFDCKDTDLAAGGLLLIPGSTQALAGGKSGKLYLVNTDGLGGMQAGDAGATQTLWFEPDLSPPYQATCTVAGVGSWSTDINSYEIFGTPAFFNGSVYLGVTPTAAGVPGPMRQFSFNGTLTAGAVTSTNILPGSYGTTPFISSANTSGGILWMIDHGAPIQSSGGTQTAAILRAYDATNMATELYDSSESSKDTPGYGIKFTSPIAANGKVYIATGHDPVSAANPQGEIDVYGLKAQ